MESKFQTHTPFLMELQLVVAMVSLLIDGELWSFVATTSKQSLSKVVAYQNIIIIIGGMKVSRQWILLEKKMVG